MLFRETTVLLFSPSHLPAPLFIPSCSPVEEVQQQEEIQQQEEVQSQDSFSPSFHSASSVESPSPKTPISLSEEENGYEGDIEA